MTCRYSASACPVVFAPAMNNRMWENPITKGNVTKLQSLGYRFIGPDSGWLACRNVGPGRMCEAKQIVSDLVTLLTSPASTPARTKKPTRT